MKNPRLKRIENHTFSIRLCNAAKALKIKTVGKMKDYCLEHDRIKMPCVSAFGTAGLLKEIENFEQSNR